MQSIRELSDHIDTLARAIGEKNKEIDTLKAELDEKLTVLNRYIGAIQSDAHVDHEIDHEEAISMVIKPLECPRCLEAIYKGLDDENYVLIPRNKVKLITSSPKCSLPNGKVMNLNVRPAVPKLGHSEQRQCKANVKLPSTTYAHEFPDTLLHELKLTAFSPSPPHSPVEGMQPKTSTLKSKRVCSYCKKPGHNRAKCKKRLATPLEP